MYARYVRGNPAYGRNDFHDNGDGTVADRATGLMWQKADSGKGMNWEQALDYAAKSRLAGCSDWRLPNAKERQSIVDYTRAPAVTQSPAISPVFQVTRLGDGEYPFFWTSTTHLEGPHQLRAPRARLAFPANGVRRRARGAVSFAPASGRPAVRRSRRRAAR
jgi:hypothetical protein